MEKLGENKKSFSERHPKLNALIGLSIIVVVLILIAWLVKIIISAAIDGVVKLSAIASKLDAVVIVALITGLVSIVGVIISSIVSKIVDYNKNRQEYLTQKRETPYGEFVDMVYKIQQISKEENKYSEENMLEDLSTFSRQITLWGSSKVIKKWIKFRENGANPEKARENIFLLEEIMNEMRKDLGLKKVKKGNLLGFFINDIKSVTKK